MYSYFEAGLLLCHNSFPPPASSFVLICSPRCLHASSAHSSGLCQPDVLLFMVTFRLASLVKGKSRHVIHGRCCIFSSFGNNWLAGGAWGVGGVVFYTEAYKLLLFRSVGEASRGLHYCQWYSTFKQEVVKRWAGGSLNSDHLVTHVLNPERTSDMSRFSWIY